MYKAFVKRFSDMVLSALALAVLSPLFLILMGIGAIAMRGNPFFVQKRPGRIDPKTGKESLIRLIKFRTMSNLKDADGNLLPDEKRLNPYGKFLRATSLDELPELLLILTGKMSLIGPRPLLVRDMVFMTTDQRRRHTVRPGLTGLAQINGRNQTTWEQKLNYDLQYVNGGITFIKDARILFSTVGKVLSHEGITEEGSATATDLGDYLLAKGAVSPETYEEKQAEAKAILKE